MTTFTPDLANGGFVSAFVPVDLVLPGKDIVTVPATLKSGQLYKRGSVLGLIRDGAVSSAAKGGGNTGNGTFVLDVTDPARLGAQVGIYKIRCTQAVVNGGVFELKDPMGRSLGLFPINPAGAGNAVTIDDQIKGVLTDGATDFVVGDGFDITVAAGSLKYTLCAAAAEDGSDIARAILLMEIDATSADKNIPVAVNGYFNEDALVFGAGHTPDTVRLALMDRGINIRTMKYSG